MHTKHGSAAMTQETKDEDQNLLRAEVLSSRQGIISMATTAITPNTLMRRDEKQDRMIAVQKTHQNMS